MADQIDWVALSIFLFFFSLVTVMGFFAARWKAAPVREHLDEWGLGWAAGIVWGSWTAWSNGLKPLASIDLGGVSYVFYVGLGALILNVVIAAITTLIVAQVSPARSARSRT